MTAFEIVLLCLLGAYWLTHIIEIGWRFISARKTAERLQRFNDIMDNKK